MDISLSEYFKLMANFDSYEVTTEDDTWYLVKESESTSIKEKLSEQADLKPYLILGDNNFGSLLVIKIGEDDEKIYSLSLRNMKLEPAGLDLNSLIHRFPVL